MATVVALVLLEGVLRLAGWRAPVRGGEQLSERYDSLLGWRGNPGSHRFTTGEYDVVLTRNERGLRGPLRPFQKPARRRRVLLLGDSFVEGYTVGDTAVVSAVLERLLNERLEDSVEVINGGTAGFSTDQELLFFASEGRRYQPDLTVLFFYANDVWFNTSARYWRGSKPRFTLDSAGLRLENVPVPPPDPRRFAFEIEGGSGIVGAVRRLDGWFGRNSRLYNLARAALRGSPTLNGLAIRLGFGAVPMEFLPWYTGPDSTLRHAWRVTEALIEALDDSVRAAGGELLIFPIPSRPAVYVHEWPTVRRMYALDDSWEAGHGFATLMEICRRRGFRCLDTLDDLRAEAATPPRLYFVRDGHWTARGHAVAAGLIAEAVVPLLERP